MDALNLFDLEQLAKDKLPQSAHDYFASGAWDEVTLRENRAAFERIKVHYRVLADVSRRNLATSLFGQKISMPILIAPTAFQKLAHPDGELATVRAAGAAGTSAVRATGAAGAATATGGAKATAGAATGLTADFLAAGFFTLSLASAA